ncbi:glycoside hydrolase family 2 TIM barrel-domain containing protein [Wenyingzhuangia sp. IMCC45533]
MISINYSKIILRTVLLCFYLLMATLVFVGLGQVFAYLNTGANKNLMLYAKINEASHYQPDIQWNNTTAKGRTIFNTNLQTVEKDYLNSWYVKQTALQNNTYKGLKNYFTKNAFINIKNIIDFNKENHIRIESTTLNHHPHINLFSEDGQLIELTDYNVTEEKRIYKDNKLILQTSETNTYQYLLLLEDGYWKTRQVLRIKPTEKSNTSTHPISLQTKIKGINYYPQDTPWNMFGDEFDEKIIEKDFKIINEIGLNTIRIFIQYADFGKSEVKPKKLEKLRKVLDIAHQHQFKTIVTLFDFYGDYSVMDWTLNNKHTLQIVNAIKNHPALFAWDVKNEPNLDFENREKSRVVAWLTQMVHYLKSIDTIHPVTIGWSNTDSAAILANELDFVSFHYYEDLNLLADKYAMLKKEIPNKQIVLGEYGISSYRGLWNPFGNSEKDQADYHKKFQEIASENNIPFISWTLYDFKKIPTEVVGKLPWRKHHQKHFGFINQKGERKESFKYIIKP